MCYAKKSQAPYTEQVDTTPNHSTQKPDAQLTCLVKQRRIVNTIRNGFSKLKTINDDYVKLYKITPGNRALGNTRASDEAFTKGKCVA